MLAVSGERLIEGALLADRTLEFQLRFDANLLPQDHCEQ
jgi:hypothetical protein